MKFKYSVKVLFFLGLTVSFICAGCIPKSIDTSTTSPSKKTTTTHKVSNKGDQDYPDGYYIHKVRFSDESLSIIAKWYTGKYYNWKVLAQCNPSINPNRIFLGDQIRIPRVLMTRQEPITNDFVEQAQPGPKRIQVKKPSRPQTAPVETGEPPKPVEEEEPLLFGPKGYPSN